MRRREEARAGLIVLVENLKAVGLMENGIGERIFANVIDVVVWEWIVARFSGVWATESEVEEDADGDQSMSRTEAPKSKEIIEDWLKGTLSPLITSVLAISNPQNTMMKEQHPQLSTMLHRLSTLRITELFDMIVDYPASLPGILDLMPSLSTLASRLHLTTSFVNTHSLNVYCILEPAQWISFELTSA